MSRYEKANTIPGTRSCHHFRPVSETEIHGKKFSNDDINVIDYFFVNPTQNFYNVNVLPNDYTTCIYDGDCWVVLVESVNVEEQDATFFIIVENHALTIGHKERIGHMYL